MPAKRRPLRLCLALIVPIIGGSFLLSRWIAERGALAAIPVEDRRILATAQQFTLYSLYPLPAEVDTKVQKSSPAFHAYLVLGETKIPAGRVRDTVLAALYGGIDKGDLDACFNPRRGIHAVQGAKTVDLVICFECLQTVVYDERGERTVTISRSPKGVFNRTLSDAGVRTAEP
jgi:hypothetical protein